MAGSSAQSPALAGSCIATGNSTTDHSRRNGLLCALAVVACVLVADPRANMPFIDDFSYTKTALDFARTGHFIYNGWAVEILGWLVPWGALFIKLFGFSFNVVRLSMLPIDMATVYLFHQILRRFGVNPQNAILGTLTMGLSPLFMPLAASYMTDVPGLLVILLCIYMCQRAVAATSDRAALLWLTFAMLLNVAGGTVRQIAWLGSLIMVPSTAWFLRERKEMKAATIALFWLSFSGVVLCIHWFNRQPYSVPEHIFVRAIHPVMAIHTCAQLTKAFFCLLLLLLPLLAGWLPFAFELGFNSRARIIVALTVLALIATELHAKGHLSGWTMPWLTQILTKEYFFLPDFPGGIIWLRLVISMAVAISALVMFELTISRPIETRSDSCNQVSSWSALAWILGPFAASYILLLIPRATYFSLQDRYVLGLMPMSIILILVSYQGRVQERLPSISVIAIIMFAVYGIAGTHDIFAESRSMAAALRRIEKTGVPRVAIEPALVNDEWANDGWVQIQGGGHINEARIELPSGAFDPHTRDLRIPAGCTSWFASATPAIIPSYFIVLSPLPCFAPTNFPPVQYRTWLPPFHQMLLVQQLANHESNLVRRSGESHFKPSDE